MLRQHQHLPQLPDKAVLPVGDDRHHEFVDLVGGDKIHGHLVGVIDGPVAKFFLAVGR